jgi:glutamate-ammonia-ligase adenylyltransferase
VRAVTRLLSDNDLARGDLGQGGAAFVLRETGTADLDALERRLTDTYENVRRMITTCLEARR